MWSEISNAEYCLEHAMHPAMTVFATSTDMHGHFNGRQSYALTEWGLPGADAPLLKMETSGDTYRYWRWVPDAEVPDGRQ